MAMIKKYKWNDAIATGNAIIDLQHKQFFAVLYDFAEMLEQGKGADGLRKALVFLKYYGEWHFGREEDIVACHGCPMAGKNKDAHKQYMVTIDGFLTQIREVGVTEDLAYSSYEKLTDWLVNHIMKIDKSNTDYIKNSEAV